MTKAQQLTLWFSGCIVLAVCIGIAPFFINGFSLTTPDAGGLACGAHTLATTGDFSTDRTAGLGYNFNICWSKLTYPAVQVVNAIVMKVWPSAAYWKVIPFNSVMVLVLCVVLMMVLVWRTTRDVTITGYVGILSSAAPMVLRPLMLTPQNIYGYAVILVIMVALGELSRYPKRWWWWLVVASCSVLLGFTHTLSFGLAAVTFTIWFGLFYLPNWRYRLGLLLVGGIAGFIVYQNNTVFTFVQNAVHLFFGSFSGYDHPLYDHPALWGYVVTALAGIGICFSPKIEPKMKWLFICWLVVPVAFAHLSAFGVHLLPERFVAFSWIGMVVFASIGLAQLGKLLRWPLWFMSVFSIIVLSAQIIHTVVYIQDDINGWSDRFKPHTDYIEALQILNKTSPDHGLLVGVMAVSNREITFAPIWYDGPIASYPWYNLDHKNIKSFTANSSVYKAVLNNPTSPEYLRVQAFYTIMTKPNSPEAKQAATTYDIEYLILPKQSQAGIIWYKANPTQFTTFYENDTYIIYQLR